MMSHSSMSDRYHSLTVVLEQDTKDEDALQLIEAIKQMRSVLSVAGSVANITSHMAEQRARTKLGQEILKVIFPPQ